MFLSNCLLIYIFRNVKFLKLKLPHTSKYACFRSKNSQGGQGALLANIFTSRNINLEQALCFKNPGMDLLCTICAFVGRCPICKLLNFKLVCDPTQMILSLYFGLIYGLQYLDISIFCQVVLVSFGEFLYF